MAKTKLSFGIPNGSLEKQTLTLFSDAGFTIEVPERGYRLRGDDPMIEFLLLRPQEIPQYVAEGKLDAGITGTDWIQESGVSVAEITDLRYSKRYMSKAKWVLAVPQGSALRSVKDLKGKVIATELVRVVENYFRARKVHARVVFSWGATEVKPPRFCDAIVDLVETGSSLVANKLKVIDTVLETGAVLIANTSAHRNPEKRAKMEEIGLLLESVVSAHDAVVLMMHVPKRQLEKIITLFSGMRKPTVRKLLQDDWYDVTAGTAKEEARSLIPRLKAAGCEGIIELPLVSCSPF